MKVAVLGAGPAGLAAAWDLAEAGIHVDVIEQESVVGGMSSSFEAAECILDYGTHGFHRSNVENQVIVDRMVELMGPEFIQFKRKAAIHFKGKYFNYPLTPKDIFLRLNPATSALCLVDFLATRTARRMKIGQAENNFEDWVKNRFGKRLYDIYFGPYTEKVWGIPPRQLTLSWAAQRIPSLSLWDVLKKALTGTTQIDESSEHSHSPYRDTGLYTKKGAKRMWERLAEHVTDLGVTIRLSTEANSINCDGRMVRSVNVSRAGRPSRVYCDWLISTIPITRMTEMLHPRPRVELLEKTRKLRYRAMVLLYVIVNKERVTPYQWIYYSSDDVYFNRLSEFKNITPAIMPAGKTALCLETTCFEGDDVWNATEDEVYSECMRGLESLGLVRKNEVETYFLRRLPCAYPTADLEYERHFPDIVKGLEQYRNLLSVGRQGCFAYLNMDETMEAGFRAAQTVIKQAQTVESGAGKPTPQKEGPSSGTSDR